MDGYTLWNEVEWIPQAELPLVVMESIFPRMLYQQYCLYRMFQLLQVHRASMTFSYSPVQFQIKHEPL